MNVNFYYVHFTVATAYYKFKDIFALIFSDKVIGDRIWFFAMLQFCYFCLNRF